VDFSLKTDDEIVRYFVQTRENVCGRFNPKQLREYRTIDTPMIRPGFILVKVGVAALLVLLLGKPAIAQKERKRNRIEVRESRREGKNKTPGDKFDFAGLIHESDGNVKEGIPGVNVVLKGTSTGTISDVDGRFVFPEKLSPGDVLQFSFIGYATKEYVITGDETEKLDVPMCVDVTQLGGVVMTGIYEVPQSPFKRWLHSTFRRF